MMCGLLTGLMLMRTVSSSWCQQMSFPGLFRSHRCSNGMIVYLVEAIRQLLGERPRPTSVRPPGLAESDDRPRSRRQKEVVPAALSLEL